MTDNQSSKSDEEFVNQSQEDILREERRRVLVTAYEIGWLWNLYRWNLGCAREQMDADALHRVNIALSEIKARIIEITCLQHVDLRDNYFRATRLNWPEDCCPYSALDLHDRHSLLSLGSNAGQPAPVTPRLRFDMMLTWTHNRLLAFRDRSVEVLQDEVQESPKIYGALLLGEYVGQLRHPPRTVDLMSFDLDFSESNGHISDCYAPFPSLRNEYEPDSPEWVKQPSYNRTAWPKVSGDKNHIEQWCGGLKSIWEQLGIPKEYPSLLLLLTVDPLSDTFLHEADKLDRVAREGLLALADAPHQGVGARTSKNPRDRQLQSDFSEISAPSTIASTSDASSQAIVFPDPHEAPKPERSLQLIVDVLASHRPEPALSIKERRRLLSLKSKVDPNDLYIGKSNAILRVFGQIDEYNREPKGKLDANQRPSEPILILGPTGSGKTEIAQIIHMSSKHGRKVFRREQAVRHKQHDTSLLMATWVGCGPGLGLGHVNQSVDGILLEADGGTIFIDEAADLGNELQSLLLDVYDRKPLSPVSGDTKQFIPNVRLIFATNQPLDILRNVLRHDLFDRIATNILIIPPLNDRKEDIFLFVESILGTRQPSPRFLLSLLRHSWEGNVRELRKVLESALKANGSVILPEHVESMIPKAVAEIREWSDEDADCQLYILLMSILQRQGLKKRKGLFTRMAKILGFDVSTVGRKVKKYQPNEQ